MKIDLQVKGLFCTVILLTATVTTNASENDWKQIENQNNHKVLLSSSNNSHSISGDANTVITGGQLHNKSDGKNSLMDNEFDRSFPASWDEAY